MSTLRISNIEAKSVPASATIDEKVKITNSSGDVLVFLDGKTSGITTVGINTTDGNITFDANSNVVVTGIITATKFVGTIEPTNLTVGGDLTIPDKIIHSGDTNTAIRFPAADTITAETNAVERVRITSDGKIGIGNIASPVNNVEIRTDAHGEGITIKSTGNTSNALTFDANRGTQGVIGVVYGRWNGTTVAQMNFVSGDDGTDKNDGYITFGTESAASNGNVNATEKLRITSGGLVGIATATPPDWCKFSVDHGQYGLTRFSNHSHLLLQNKNAGTTDFWSLAPRDNGSISMVRGTTDTNGTVDGANARFSISSAGRVGVGSDASNVISFFEANYTSGTVAYPFENANSSIQSYDPYDHEVTIKNNTNGTENNFCGIYFRPGAHSDGNRISAARISAIDAGDYRADLTFGTRGYRGGNIRFQEVLRLDSNGNASLKTGNLAFASGSGIDFSATSNSSGTMSSELLADYEEGTWTPTLYYGSGTSEPTYSFRNAHYIRVGKQVTAWFSLGIASFTASYTEAYIGGLPFQSNDPNGQWKYLNHIMGYQYASGWGDGGSDKHIFLAIYNNQTKMMLNHEGNHLSTGNIGNNQRFSCTVTYQTD